MRIVRQAGAGTTRAVSGCLCTVRCCQVACMLSGFSGDCSYCMAKVGYQLQLRLQTPMGYVRRARGAIRTRKLATGALQSVAAV